MYRCVYRLLVKSMFIERQGSLAVVVSPLTSLMMDQRQKFVPTALTVEFVGEG